MSINELGPAFFLAVVVILLVCRLAGRVLRYVGQPPVVGEMVAGVLLGPSVLGLITPVGERALFPEDLRPVLYVAGQIGLAIYMFQAGYEFRLQHMRRVLRPAASISVVGIVVPLALGTALAWSARDKLEILPAHVPLTVSTAFVGVALAITAFPVMARIIAERGLTGTHHGSLSLASGAIDDVIAWVLLAGVLGLAKGSPQAVLIAVVGSAVLVGALVLVAKSGGRVLESAARRSPDMVLLVTVLALFLAAWYTERIGLYAVFGAFSLGVFYPRSAAADRAVASLAPTGRLIFLPLFFTYSGLNTDFSLFAQPALLVFAGVCVLAATIGKLGACWAAARLAGEPSAVARRVGTLMNARGLMQLIAINVGLAAGIVSHAVFTVLVVVALVTTVTATPLLTFWDWLEARRRGQPADADVVVAEATRSAPRVRP